MFPFDSINDTQFQDLCIEFLVAEGCSRVLGGGRGPDQNKDILVDISYSSLFGIESRRFLVECKHKKSVGKNDFAAARNALSLHNVDGLLIITSGDFSGTVVTQANAIKNSEKDPYIIELWNGLQISRKLRIYPQLINKYSFSDDNENILSRFAEGKWQDLLAEYAPMPISYSIETYPLTSETKQVVTKIAEYSQNFRIYKPPITLLKGGIGSGKTTFGRYLLNLYQHDKKTVAAIRSRDFSSSFFRYQLEDKRDYLIFSQLCENVDVLLIDEFGLYDDLRDASYTQELAAQEFCHMLQKRRDAQKPSIMVISSEANLGAICRMYLEKLTIEEMILDLGNYNLFRHRAENRSFFTEEETHVNLSNNEINSHVQTQETPELVQPRHKVHYVMSDLANEHLHEKLTDLQQTVNELEPIRKIK